MSERRETLRNSTGRLICFGQDSSKNFAYAEGYDEVGWRRRSGRKRKQKRLSVSNDGLENH